MLFRYKKIIAKNFKKTIAFFLELWYNIRRSMDKSRKSDVLKHVEEVSKWQSAVFAEKELFSVRPYHTRIARPTEPGSLTSAR